MRLPAAALTAARQINNGPNNQPNNRDVSGQEQQWHWPSTGLALLRFDTQIAGARRADGQTESSKIMGPAIIHGMRPSHRRLVASHGHSLEGALQDGRGHVLLRATRHNGHRRRRSNLPVVTHALDFRCGLCGEGRCGLPTRACGERRRRRPPIQQIRKGATQPLRRSQQSRRARCQRRGGCRY